MADFGFHLNNLISITRASLSKEEYAKDDGLILYTKAVLFAITKNKAAKSREFPDITKEDFRASFLELHNSHEKAIAEGDGWLDDKALRSPLKGKFSRCSFPLGKVYASITKEESKASFRFSLLSCIKMALPEDKSAQRDNIAARAAQYRKQVPEIDKLFEGSDIDTTEAIAAVERIGKKLTGIESPELGADTDIVSSIVDVLIPLKGDSQLNDDIRYVLKCINNDKVRSRLPELVSKLSGTRK